MNERTFLLSMQITKSSHVLLDEILSQIGIKTVELLLYTGRVLPRHVPKNGLTNITNWHDVAQWLRSRTWKYKT